MVLSKLFQLLLVFPSSLLFTACKVIAFRPNFESSLWDYILWMHSFRVLRFFEGCLWLILNISIYAYIRDLVLFGSSCGIEREWNQKEEGDGYKNCYLYWMFGSSHGMERKR